MTVWNEGVFIPSLGNLESLANVLDRFDFAVLMLTPDDAVQSRGAPALSPRDNLMFELGLFMGRLGRLRTFVIRSTPKNLKIPSDLAGVMILSFDSNRSDGNLLAAVGPACFVIRDAIHDLGPVAPKETAPLENAKRVERIDLRTTGEPLSPSSTQAKILQILADGGRSFGHIRRELDDRFASETRPALVREKLQDLVAKQIILVSIGSAGEEYEITSLGRKLVKGALR